MFIFYNLIMLEKILKEYNLEKNKIAKLNQLRKIVLEYNEHTNLTSIVKEEEFNVKHILDSISIIKFYNLEKKNILDVGSGGGLPGLVLSIVLEDSKITMIDSNNKKINFIKHAIKELKLENAFTIYSRVEDAKIDKEFDITLSRAVAPLNILLEITMPTVKLKGKLIYYKGINLANELPKKWEETEKKLGIEFNEIKTFNLDNETNRSFISFTKVKIINNFIKRDYSQIKKKPIFGL